MTLCKAILIAKKDCKNPYCQTYLHAIPLAIEESRHMFGNPVTGLRTQLLYVVSNMTAWRGDNAKAVRACLKSYFPKYGKGTAKEITETEIRDLEIL